jgi:putative toxin-antitoxin system antitoxin component (TIGR02293 family)
VLFEGDREAAIEWLGAPRPALGGVTPFSLIASEVGGREVEALIDRLEHGVFS